MKRDDLIQIERSHRLSLEALLAWGFGSLIISSLLAAMMAFGVWYLVSAGFDEYEQQDAPIALHASNGVDAWARVRRHEELFVMASIGLKDRAESERLVQLWRDDMDDIRDYLTQIRKIADVSDSAAIDLLPRLEAALARYSMRFISTVASLAQLGDPDAGLEGEMQSRARAMERALAQAGSPELNDSFFRLNRIQMDFSLTHGERYINEFSEEIAYFTELSTDNLEKITLLGSLNEYQGLFEEYVRVASDMDASKVDFMDAGELVEAGLEELERNALQNTHGTLQTLESRVIKVTLLAAIMALSIAVLGAMIAVFVSGRIRLAAQRVIGFATRVAAGRLETRLAHMDGGKFGALELALNTMADRLQESDELMTQQARGLETSNRRIALLSEMTGLLQTTINSHEAAAIIASHLNNICLAQGGSLYLYNESRDHLDEIAHWGEVFSVGGFVPQDCWALRRGQPYGSIEDNTALLCAHVRHGGAEQLYLCLPLVTQDGMLGLLHVIFGSSDPAGLEEEVRFSRRISEQLSLALANLRLRDALRAQSFSDVLTGLWNRRFLEESLTREFARAARDKAAVAVLMIDADHFKRYNDIHGHEAGDAALRQLGRVLKDNCRGADLVCRYGGEEFTAVLPGTTCEGALAWAARLLDQVRTMKISVHGNELPGLTISIGIAHYPEHGNSVESVLKAADLALYEAKHTGRDRIVIRDVNRAS